MPQIPNFTVVYVDRNRNNWAGTPMSQSYVLKVQKTLEDNRTVYRVLLILVGILSRSLVWVFLYAYVIRDS